MVINESSCRSFFGRNSTFENSNVLIWRIDGFSEFYDQSMIRDIIASEPFVLKHTNFAEVEYCLRFKPKTIDDPDSARLHIQLFDPPSESLISMECESSMESTNNKRSETKIQKMSFHESTQFSDWRFFIFRGDVRVLHINDRLRLLPFTLSGQINWLTLKEEKFYSKGQTEDYTDFYAVYLHVIDLAEHSKVLFQSYLWIKNAETRLSKTGLTHVIYTEKGYGFVMYLGQVIFTKRTEEGPGDCHRTSSTNLTLPE
ncbi:hypothetical protein M3Y96_00477300 [Aphelenchoides besseyi]|nr:hypothetical protein M3Y96_00477300 [Aphelenchoides besseyi]